MSFFSNFNVITKIYTVLNLKWEKESVKTKGDNRFFYALSIRLEGSSSIMDEKFNLSIKKNDLLFVPKKTKYMRSSNSSERVIVVHFDMLNHISLPEVFTPVDSSIFLRYFENLYSVWKKKDTGYMYECIIILNKIMKNILEQQALKNTKSISRETLIQPAISFIKENFTNCDISIEYLANLCHVSSVYFRKIFKSFYGTSPLDYINNLRLNYATELLTTNYYTIEEVAEKSGFLNPKYFSVFYKKKKGVSPSKVSLEPLKV